MEFWNDVVTDKSWGVLINLRRKFDFILIGGWAVYLLTKSVKSKDIDIIIDFENLDKLRHAHRTKKTHFLKKYEAMIEGISVDIYVPFYSRFSIPPEDIQKNTIQIEGFDLPTPEILLIMKQQAELSRKDSVKGQKDRTDIITLLLSGVIETSAYLDLISRYDIPDYPQRLRQIIANAKKEFLYLNITDPRKIKLIKKRLLDQLKQ
jgi:hypothetical protein